MAQQVLDRPQPAATATDDPAKKYPALTTHDRCDGTTMKMDRKSGEMGRGPCGAQAFIRVVLASGADLVFCGHCMGAQTVGRNAEKTKSAQFATRRESLLAAGATIIDVAYEFINHKPSDGSGAKNG
jgi:hypothetical protein